MSFKDLIEELEHLVEKKSSTSKGSRAGEAHAAPNSSHDPFKTQSTNGPGPHQDINKKTGEWNCKCADYVCTCHGKHGKTKTMKTNKAKKKRDNRAYMDFLQGRSNTKTSKKAKKGTAKK